MFRVVLLAVLFVAAGCGKKKKKDEYGKVSVAFGNSTSLTLGETKASSLKFRLMYANISENKEGATAETGYNGNNVGQGAFIWGASKCTSYNKVDDESDAFTVSLKSDAECDAAGLSYFDLNRTSAEVNAELNSQNAKVLPGTYRYISIAALGAQQGGNNTYENVKWAHADSGVSERAYASIVTEWSAKIDPPLTIGDEQSVLLTLSYSLNKVVSTGLTDAQKKVAGGGVNQPGRYDDCNDAKTVCMNFPSLTVTATNK